MLSHVDLFSIFFFFFHSLFLLSIKNNENSVRELCGIFDMARNIIYFLQDKQRVYIVYENFFFFFFYIFDWEKCTSNKRNWRNEKNIHLCWAVEQEEKNDSTKWDKTSLTGINEQKRNKNKKKKMLCLLQHICI